MRTLIAIHSCQADIRNGRNQAIRETWLKDANRFSDYKFFIGGFGESQEDEVWLDVDDTGDALIYKDAALLRWALDHSYERIFKTETDVYVDLPVMFNSDYCAADVIGRVIGDEWGKLYPRTNVYCFIQGHGIWYSQKAAELIADNLIDTYNTLSKTSWTEPNQADLGPRASDLWSGQLLTKAWQDGVITVRPDSCYAHGPFTYHLQGDYHVKQGTPAWLHKMHRELGRS